MDTTNINNVSRRYTKGAQRITQRFGSCFCGCGGKDSQHARHIKRMIRWIRFVHPKAHTFHSGREFAAIAEGTYSHPMGERKRLLMATKYDDGSWHPYGWRWDEAV